MLSSAVFLEKTAPCTLLNFSREFLIRSHYCRPTMIQFPFFLANVKRMGWVRDWVLPPDSNDVVSVQLQLALLSPEKLNPEGEQLSDTFPLGLLLKKLCQRFASCGLIPTAAIFPRSLAAKAALKLEMVC